MPRQRCGNARGRETNRPPRARSEKISPPRSCRSSLSSSGRAHAIVKGPHASALPSPIRPPMTESPASPVMVQYHEIKRANPGCLLFFGRGDSYELCFEDAVAAAQALDIALTKRGRHEGADIPMCGVPVHTAEAYLARLIRAGFKVAMCDQVEDPAEAKRRGAKTLRRAVVRVV